MNIDIGLALVGSGRRRDVGRGRRHWYDAMSVGVERSSVEPRFLGRRRDIHRKQHHLEVRLFGRRDALNYRSTDVDVMCCAFIRTLHSQLTAKSMKVSNGAGRANLYGNRTFI